MFGTGEFIGIGCGVASIFILAWLYTRLTDNDK